VAESRLYSAGLSAKARSVHGLGARQARHGTLVNPWWVIFAEGNRIVKYCVVVLNYLFGVSNNSQLPFLASVLVKMAPFAKKPGYGIRSGNKSRVFALRIMGFPQEFRTVRFDLEPKRCKSVSLSAKRSVFTLVGLAHGVVTEKLRFP
jgi:hypothetical protein